MTIWYILCSFGTFFPFCTKNNLATLIRPQVTCGFLIPMAVHVELSLTIQPLPWTPLPWVWVKNANG
jgi:hypothetical protein